MNEVVDTLDNMSIVKSILIGVLIAGAILLLIGGLAYVMVRVELHVQSLRDEARTEQQIRHSEMLKSAGLDPNDCEGE